MDYRARLFECYRTSHFGHIRNLSPQELRKQARTFGHYFGPLLPQDKKARILEVGCGHGAFLYFLREQGYENCEGIDVSPEQVEVAKRLGLSNIVCADVRDYLRDSPDSYDCIVGIDFLEHFPKAMVLDLLELIHQNLAPRGRLILQSPNADGPFAGRYRYWDFTHEFALTATSAAQILRAAGFQQIRVYPVEPFVHSTRSLLRVLIWKVFKGALQLYLAAETGQLQGHILTQNLIVVADKSH